MVPMSELARDVMMKHTTRLDVGLKRVLRPEALKVPALSHLQQADDWPECPGSSEDLNTMKYHTCLI